MIKAVYPEPATALPPRLSSCAEQMQLPRRQVEHRDTSEIVLAVDIPTLVALARTHDGMVEFVPQVGDFVAADEPLFVLYGARRRSTIAHCARQSLSAPSGRSSRTRCLRSRIIVDIGLKALSPAINDPTTGVLALDQVHRLLRMVGRRKLRGEVILDDAGQPRVIFRTPNWEDYVQVACSEIRACGANNLQIARRMRAMLENLRGTLPEHRRPALGVQLDLLDWAVQAHFSRPEELALARTPDSQGLGGSSGSRFTESG